MATDKSPEIHLRTVGDLIDATEWLFNKQRKGEIDSKTADALNTTLKGSSYLLAKLHMDVAKLYVMARIKKIELPAKMFPAGMLNTSDIADSR